MRRQPALLTSRIPRRPSSLPCVVSLPHRLNSALRTGRGSKSLATQTVVPRWRAVGVWERILPLLDRQKGMKGLGQGEAPLPVERKLGHLPLSTPPLHPSLRAQSPLRVGFVTLFPFPTHPPLSPPPFSPFLPILVSPPSSLSHAPVIDDLGANGLILPSCAHFEGPSNLTQRGQGLPPKAEGSD